MEAKGFRKLTASEVECRVSTVSEKGCSLLLFKDARVDQNLLDETYGIFGWQRKHEIIDGQLFCTVSVKNPETGEWVSKQDVGTESYTEKEKGRASDSFKRACFNLGIGRELYTAPFIWVSKSDCTIETKNGKPTTYDRFNVKEIGYDKSGNINYLVIVNAKTDKTVYSYGKRGTSDNSDKPAKRYISKAKQDALLNKCNSDNVDPKSITTKYGIDSFAELTDELLTEICGNWSKEYAVGK